MLEHSAFRSSTPKAQSSPRDPMQGHNYSCAYPIQDLGRFQAEACFSFLVRAEESTRDVPAIGSTARSIGHSFYSEIVQSLLSLVPDLFVQPSCLVELLL